MYVGHRTEEGREQALLDHLLGTQAIASVFGETFGFGEVAGLLGLYHDIGKYSAAFQRRILENGPKVDHSTAGGQEIAKLLGEMYAYPLLGHHGGLMDGGSGADVAGTASMHGRLKKQVEDYSAFSAEVQAKMPAAPDFMPLEAYGFSLAFLVRMLFSCLVDADYLDTEAFMSGGDIARGGYDDIPTLCDRLDAHLAASHYPDNPINQKRDEILNDCLRAAEEPQGLFTLTVPTGGGKTVSSLAFALRHAKRHGMQRVIYVIPYMSIIEQNATVFASILGEANVLEHHSGVDYDHDENSKDPKYLATENWDAPVVVTTNVQFFESLFAAKTSRCRKLHSIANSVIIFDEAQMLPLPYLLPCVRAIAELVHSYRCTAVLCTATQPALGPLFPKEIGIREICGDPAGLYDFFRRTRLRFAGVLTDEALADRMRGQPQALCIVASRKQAQRLYGMLEGEGTYHLSTWMYPEHRKAVLKTVRERLKQGLPCRLIATSLIEAGVDVDFPVVYRADAGLDSILQAAGRCNREGKRPREDSEVTVFTPDPDVYRPLDAQSQQVAAMKSAARQHEDAASLEAIHTYFSMLYTLRGENLDQKKIVERMENGYPSQQFPFACVAREFKLIESNTHTILIPTSDEAAVYATRLRKGERSRALLRAIGRYCVEVYDKQYRSLYAAGVIEPLDESLAVLCLMSAYDPNKGLLMDIEGGEGIFVDV